MKKELMETKGCIIRKEKCELIKCKACKGNGELIFKNKYNIYKVTCMSCDGCGSKYKFTYLD